MGPGEFLNINFFTALFTLFNFIAVFLVLKHFLFGPVMKIIKDRQDEIDRMYEDAGKARENAENLQAEYQQKLSAAQETSERIVKDAIIRGQHKEEEIIRQANSEASAILNKAAADISQEKKKAINDAKNEISDIALTIAEKVVGRQLNAEDHNKLLDEFIDELGEKA